MNMFKYETFTHRIMATCLSLVRLLCLSLFVLCLDTTINSDCLFTQNDKRKEKNTNIQKGVKQMRVN